ncbi:nicotinamidase [Salinisphaera sp. T5B8]|uniref:bifunctional nicotinamidase/pyrazinamidase n=1 Tax=Salinisphaera sp. T5B8 TaxID=1304154 RepID=UPI00333FD7CF
MTEALLLVDIQNDFLPGGALAVADGDAVVPVANALMPAFDYVVASQDWHPPQHLSFAAEHPGRAPFEVIELDGYEQIMWPAHCVQGQPGAGFASALDIAGIDHVVRKGMDRRLDSYSAFYDNHHRNATGLGAHLKARGIDHLVVLGLAADVCVKFTVLDALAEGFAVTLVRDGVRGVDMQPGDTEAAIEAMRAAGAMIADSATLAGAPR